MDDHDTAVVAPVEMAVVPSPGFVPTFAIADVVGSDPRGVPTREMISLYSHTLVCNQS